jgi:hypothetical protein
VARICATLARYLAFGIPVAISWPDRVKAARMDSGSEERRMIKRIFPIVMVAVLAACGGDAGEDAAAGADSTAAGATIQGVDSAAAATQAAPLPSTDSVTGAAPAPMDSTAHADSGHAAGTDSAAAH